MLTPFSLAHRRAIATILLPPEATPIRNREMVAPPDSAARPPEFVRRADWKGDSNYPPDDMTDASAWAWEFLRRNHAYQLDFDRWRRDFTGNTPGQ
ncbi:transcriptional regulator domain-containing protein [Burkholderia paludis]|uniref:transcriptional regulator domain-containing protein n=1 Tax=Burkholderia paludis TaxID=1506587 RepID=UPI003463AF46